MNFHFWTALKVKGQCLIMGHLEILFWYITLKKGLSSPRLILSWGEVPHPCHRMHIYICMQSGSVVAWTGRINLVPCLVWLWGLPAYDHHTSPPSFWAYTPQLLRAIPIAFGFAERTSMGGTQAEGCFRDPVQHFHSPRVEVSRQHLRPEMSCHLPLWSSAGMSVPFCIGFSCV